MRASSAAILVLIALGGCQDAGEAGARPAAGTTMIDCSLGGVGGFGRDCFMERVEQDGASLLIVRHPDGAFRRFELGVPGYGLVTADGAQQAEVTDRGGYVEVRVDPDRYHLPVVQ